MAFASSLPKRRKRTWGGGVGLANAQGQPISAAKGGVDGPVSINALGQRTILPIQAPAPFVINASLGPDMQSLVGRDGYVKGLNVQLTTDGLYPPEFPTYESFLDFANNGAQLEIQIGRPGQGQTQAIYSSEQVKDTHFMQRELEILISPDPGVFQSVLFIWRKPGAVLTANPGGAYTVNLNVMTYWRRK